MSVLNQKTPSIAAAWKSYREMVIPLNANPFQVEESRLAFLGGACVLYYAIINSLDPGVDPTDEDMKRMQAIQDEIDAFAETLDERVVKRSMQ